MASSWTKLDWPNYHPQLINHRHNCVPHSRAHSEREREEVSLSRYVSHRLRGLHYLMPPGWLECTPTSNCRALIKSMNMSNSCKKMRNCVENHAAQMIQNDHDPRRMKVPSYALLDIARLGSELATVQGHWWQMSFGDPETCLNSLQFLAGPEACIRVFNLSSTKSFVPERVEIKMYTRSISFVYVRIISCIYSYHPMRSERIDSGCILLPKTCRQCLWKWVTLECTVARCCKPVFSKVTSNIVELIWTFELIWQIGT